MVDVERSQNEAWCRFILRPNRSISWRGTCLFFAGLCAVSGTVAIGLTMLGYWPVLAFAGLELSAVWVGLYLVARRGLECEVISIDGESIRIESGRRHPERQWTLVRVWAQVILERCPKRWYPSRLLIRSHGRAVEVGRFLNEDERQFLAAELSRSI